MAAEDKPASQGTLATVIATAAVTLAIGVTLAAVGGYWTPAVANETKPAKGTEPTPAEVSPARRSIVFVPVAVDPPSDPGMVPPASSPPEVTLAQYERSRDRDRDDDHRHHRRKHREHHQGLQEREHEDD